MLKGTLGRKQTDFIYLLYDPTELDIEPDAKDEIDRIYRRTCCECKLVDFAELYRVILEFLVATKFKGALTTEDIDDMVCNFKFTLTSQKHYQSLI
jgi:hypothetical protein